MMTRQKFCSLPQLIFKSHLRRMHASSFYQTSVSRSQSARNIGVTFDDEMLLKQHISTVCQTALFHLRSIGQIRRYLTEDASTTRLVHSLVSTRIDYCNSLLVNLPACSLQELQRVLNTAARTVSLLPKRDDIIPVLISLHWLPIEHRIHYKIILFVFCCLHGLAPSYLSELLKLYAPERENLRSSDKVFLDYSIPSTKYGESAFSVSGSVLWNSLPDDIRLLDYIGTVLNPN